MSHARVAIALVVVLSACTSEPSVSQTSALVSVVRGDVRVGDDSTRTETRVQAESTLTTSRDGLARVRFDDGAFALLDAATQLRVASGSRAEVRRGRLFLDVPADEPFVLATPEGELRLIDAQVSVELGDAGVRVDVLRGNVSHRSGSRRGVVAEGRKLLLTRSEAKVEPQLVFDDWTMGLASPGPRDARALEGVGTLEGRRPGDVGLARWPLIIRTLDVDVRIVGDLAVTEVEQVFFNPASATLEGLYRIRVPEGAVLQRFAVDRDGRMVDGYVREKRAAAAAYQAQVYEGSTLDPALLEWDSPGAYRARIHPIRPGESRRIAVRYSTWLPKTGDGMRTYRYPMGGGESASEVEALSIDVELAGTNYESLRASHGATRSGSTIRLRRSGVRPRSDFVVDLLGESEDMSAYRARHVDPLRAPDAVRPPGEESDYFFIPLVVDPPTPNPTSGTDLVVVADLSAGSDRSALELGRTVIESIAAQLRAGDRIAIVGGDLRLRALASDHALGAASRDRVRTLLDALARAPSGGATDLGAMFTEAAAMLDPARNGAVVYVGDGAPTVGELGAGAMLERIGRLPNPLRAFGVAIGDGANAELLASICRGSGRVVRVTTRAGAAEAALDLVSHASRPVVSRVSVDLGNGLERIYPREATATEVGTAIPVVARVRGSVPTSVMVTGVFGGRPFRRRIPIHVETIEDSGDLRLRWATARLEGLLLDGARRAEVVDLGVRSGVITPFTSLYVPSAAELDALGPRALPLYETASLEDVPRVSASSGWGVRALEVALAPIASLYGCSRSRRAPPDGPAPPPQAASPADSEGGSGQAAHDDTADMDARDAERHQNRSAIAGAAAPEDMQMARESAQEAPSATGEEPSNEPNPAMDALGNLLGGQIGESGGAGGLGLSGGGQGGGGTGSGSYGTGNSFGTIGRGGGGGTGSGYGRGGGGLGDRGAIRPVVRPAGSAIVSRGLTSDQVRRVVQRNNSQVQHCYEQGLQRNPNLAGRVTVMFMITPTGSVGSSTADNGIGDSVVSSCIAGATRRWAFPQPDPSQPVAVRFSFALSVSGSGGSASGSRPDTTVAVAVRVSTHARRRCSDASSLMLESREALWRERLALSPGPSEWARVYEDAVSSCEIKTARDRRRLLELVLERAGNVQTMVTAYEAMVDRSTRTSMRRSILARVRTPDDLRAVRTAFGTATVDATLLGTELARATDDPSRIAVLRRLLARYEGDLDLSMRLVALYERTSRVDDAKQLALAIRMNPLTDAGKRTAIGEMFLRMGDEAEARRTFSEIVEFAPTDELARRRLGDLYRAHGWFDDAYRQFRSLEALRPDDPTVLLLLAQAAAGAGRIDEALRLESQLVETARPGGAEGIARTAILWSSVRLAELRAEARAAGDSARLRAYFDAMRRGGVLREAGALRATLVWSHPDADLALYAAHPGLGLARPNDLSPDFGLEAFDVRERAEGAYRIEVRRGAHDTLTRVQAKLLVVFREGHADEKVVIVPIEFGPGEGVRSFVVEGDTVNPATENGGAR